MNSEEQADVIDRALQIALAERLETANEAARELLRDLNTAGKDLRRSIGEARDLINEVIAVNVAQQVSKAVETQLGKLGEATEEAMRRAVAKVDSEFDKLAALFTGKDTQDPLEDLIRKANRSSKGKR